MTILVPAAEAEANASRARPGIVPTTSEEEEDNKAAVVQDNSGLVERYKAGDAKNIVKLHNKVSFRVLNNHYNH
jgi:hypothetical protein